MKRTIKVSRDYINVKNIGVDVGIVTSFINGRHNQEFQVFSVKDAIPEIGTIGVTDETFTISFTPNFYGRFAFVVYLDGINSHQGSGISSINSIPEYLRHQYKVHKGRFIIENENKRTGYLDRYLQMNGENRRFNFTAKENTGINEILISDPSLTNKIEVYVWKEYLDEYDNDFDEFPNFGDEDFSPKSKIGAGEPTKRDFKSGLPLNNPTFLGKATFIHQPAEKLKHLGKMIISAKIDDPMDQVPRS